MIGVHIFSCEYATAHIIHNKSIIHALLRIFYVWICNTPIPGIIDGRVEPLILS